MLLATKDEAGVHPNEEENDFMLDNAYEDNALEELNASMIMMTRIQPTDLKCDAEPTYDDEFINKVNASQIDHINGLLLKSDHEQRHHEKLETIIHTYADVQIDFDIIFDDPYVENNSGQAKHNTNALDQSLHDFESLRNNVQVEDENQRKMNIELKSKKELRQREIETYRERVMAAPVISISLAVSVESVGSVFPRVILIGSISVKVPIAPEADPSKSSLPPVSVAPMVSPFLCSDDSESDTEMPERHVSPTPHDDMLTRWRSKVASRSSSPTTSNLEIPTTPILPTSFSVDIPIGRLYRTHPGGPCRALTVRKSVRPLSSHRLALRYTSHHLDRFTSGSSLGHSSSDRLVLHWDSLFRPIVLEVFPLFPSIHDDILSCQLREILLQTSSALRTISDKRSFRDSISPEDSVEEDIDADILAVIEADAMAVEVAVVKDVMARVDASIDMEVDVGVDVKDEVEDEVESSDRGTMEVGVYMVARIDIPDGMLMPDAMKHLEQRELEARSLIAGGERASLLEQVASLEGRNTRLRGTVMMKSARSDRFRRRMNFMENELRQVRRFRYYDRMRFRRLETFAVRRLALATYEATRAANALEAESQSQNGSDGDNGNGGNGNGGDGNGENGNGGNGNGKNGNLNENNRGARPVAQECTYQDFIKCQPLNFKGTEGVVRLIRWFEKMETMFHISNCPEKYQVNYATCTLLNSALTWWNSHKRTVGT
ncbi:hypothetical protein Tco_1118989 [Tanacetum coccineum]